MSLEAYFQEDEPVKEAYDRFRALFGGDEIVYIVYEARDGDIFSETSLNALKGVQEELQNYRFSLKPEEKHPLDHITDVKTLINVKYMEADADTLLSREFIGDHIPTTEESRERKRFQALEHPDYPLLYLSRDSRYGGIIVKTDFNAVILEEETNETVGQGVFDDEEDEGLFEGIDEEVAVMAVPEDDKATKFKMDGAKDYEPFVFELEKILNKPVYSNALEFHPVGNPIVMSFFNKIVRQEVGIIIGGLFFLISVMLWILFRSFCAVVWPLVIVAVSIIWVLGLIGWSGLSMTLMIEILVFLVVAVGMADVLHILSGYIFFRNQGQNHGAALRSVFKKSGLACFLTSITTAIGLMALVFVPIVPIQRFGVFSALGVFFAFFFTIFYLPLMLDLWSPFSKKHSRHVATSGEHKHVIQKLLQKVENYGSSHPLPIIGVFLVAGLFFILGGLRVQVDYNMIEVLKERCPIRGAYELVDQVLGGTGNMEILVDTGRIDGMKDPSVLNAIDDLQNYIKSNHKALVVATNSLVNVTKDAYKILNEGREEMYIIPQDARMLGQTLFLFGNANPKDRRQLVSDDYRMGRVGINVRNTGSRACVKFINDVRSYIEKRFKVLQEPYPDINMTITGQFSLLSLLLDFISWSQIKSFGLALCIISFLLLVVLGSKRIGLIAILPNIFPILTIFGLMGYLGVLLDTDTLLIAPIIIGIAVDDTIHFLIHFRIEQTECGDAQEAIVRTIREVGQAIVFTSIVLSAGFLIFLASVHKGVSNFGIFSAVAIMTALLADLLLLPAMLVLFKGGKMIVLKERSTAANG